MKKLDEHSTDFQELFCTHYEMLCMRAFQILHDRKTAEDTVQDAFLTLWERREKVDFDRPLLPLLTVFVKHRAIDLLRMKSGRGKSFVSDLSELDRYIYTLVADHYEEELQTSQLQEEIAVGISQLPEQCRRIFLLSREAGLKNRQIAEQLNISIKAVEKQMGIALSRLRLRLSRSGFMGPFF